MSLPIQPSDPLRHVLAWPERGVEMAFRLIPAGEFRMGSRENFPNEEPVHRVKIAQPFWLAETPVTQAQFALWTRAMGIEHENNFKGLDDHPAENLDWRQAVNYCKWLTEVQAGKLPGPLKVPKVPKRSWFACLPTEAEWEYACRAGTDTDNHTGDGEAALAEAGWFDEDFDSGSTHPVREKQPNQFGLFDLHGNVWEWCHDAWNEAAYRRHVDGEEDRWPSIRAKDYALRWDEMLNDSRPRVIRGGSWDAPAGNCRSASRLWWVPGARPWCLGFRVCLAPRSGNSQPSRTKRAKAEPGAGDEGGGTPPKSDAPGAAGAGRLAIDLSSARLPRRPKKIK